MVKIDKLIRSRRRSIGLTINTQAQLIVRAPIRTPIHEIERLVDQKRSWIDLKRAMFAGRLSETPPKLPNELRPYIKSRALRYIQSRVKVYATLAGVSYKSVKVNEARTRWGSCGSKGSLNFTWRLILAPSRVIDYVVVHELMHLKQANHSHKFWYEVKNLVPDFDIDENWLKNNGHLLRV